MPNPIPAPVPLGPLEDAISALDATRATRDELAAVEAAAADGLAALTATVATKAAASDLGELAGRVTAVETGKANTADVAILAASVATAHAKVDSLRVSRWEELVPPIFIAHRGGSLVAPANTMAAWRWAAGLGYIVEADLWYTKDRAIIANHDQTVDAAAGRTDGLKVGDLTLEQIKQLDFAQGFRPDIYSPQRPQTFEEFMELARTGALLCPEVRDSSGMGTDVAQRIVRAGLQHMFLVQSFSAAQLLAVKAVDPAIRTMRIAAGNIPVSEAQANGYWAVCPEKGVLLGTLGADYVAQMHAIGVKVFSYTVNYLKEAEALNAIGVDGYFSDDPPHVANAGYRVPSGGTTTIKIPPIFPLSRWRWVSALKGSVPVVEDGFATFANHAAMTTEIQKITVPDSRTADTPATQTIETNLKVVATPGGTNRYLGLYFCWSSEQDGINVRGDAIYGSTGYYFSYRLDGWVDFYVVVNGASTKLASVKWGTLTAGQVIPIRIDITANAFTITRPDTGQTQTLEDATNPRGGFVRLLNSGVVGGIGDVKITY